MNVRWLFFDYVDPALQLSRAERRAVRRRARGLVRPTWRSTILTFLVILPLLSIYVWGVLHYSERFVNAVAPGGGLLLRLVIVYVAVWIVIAWLGRWMYRPFVLRAINDAGYAICTNCGYDLRGSRADSPCPECGTRRGERNRTRPT